MLQVADSTLRKNKVIRNYRFFFFSCQPLPILAIIDIKNHSRINSIYKHIVRNSAKVSPHTLPPNTREHGDYLREFLIDSGMKLAGHEHWGESLPWNVSFGCHSFIGVGNLTLFVAIFWFAFIYYALLKGQISYYQKLRSSGRTIYSCALCMHRIAQHRVIQQLVRRSHTAAIRWNF